MLNMWQNQVKAATTVTWMMQHQDIKGGRESVPVVFHLWLLLLPLLLALLLPLSLALLLPLLLVLLSHLLLPMLLVMDNVAMYHLQQILMS